MTKEQKATEIENISTKLNGTNVIYLSDISSMNSVKTQELRRMCFSKGVYITVVKNTLLKVAMERSGRDFKEVYPALKSNTALMISDIPSLPGKIIKELSVKTGRPILKAAIIGENFYLGKENLDTLASIKTKNELIADIIVLLGSPIRNFISQLENKDNRKES